MRFFVPPSILSMQFPNTGLDSQPPKPEGKFAVSPEALLKWEESLIHESEKIPSIHADLVEGFSVWEFDQMCVVLGRGSKVEEANTSQCEQDSVPIVRRCSGGASIVAGPGCLMYSVVISLELRPELRSINAAHQFVMDKIHRAVVDIDHRVDLQGICDLSIDGRKFSGNALRYKRDWLLYHGTILYDFPIQAIACYLNFPPRQPSYREGRSHEDFLTNIQTSREQLSQRLCDIWGVRRTRD